MAAQVRANGRDGDNDVKMLMGMIVGALAAWLYTSERARNEVQRRLSVAPESVSQLQQTAASVAASGAQRVAEAIDSAPLPDRVKDTASGAAFNVWAAADQFGQSPSEAGPAAGGEAREEH